VKLMILDELRIQDKSCK